MSTAWEAPKTTALLVLADGTVIEGFGCGGTGAVEGEVCFNTALTGYEEILTDPSYAGQIVTFTFPHIGNVGANDEDIEDLDPDKPQRAVGAIFRASITEPSNYRSTAHLDHWLKQRGVIGLTGVDTRALTAMIREKGMPNAVIAHDPEGQFDVNALKARAAGWGGIVGADMAKDATSRESRPWSEGPWVWDEGFGPAEAENIHIVAIDFGIKRNILRRLASLGARVTVVPANSSAGEILGLQPDGIFLSNGPGDPAATGTYSVPDDPRTGRSGPAGLRHLPRPPDACAGARRKDGEDAPGPPRREPPGQGPHHRQGRDRLDESRLRRR